jgi:hypothetical protein
MAAQKIALEQEIAVSVLVPIGGVWEFQVVPSTVFTTWEPPIATHSSIVKQEIDSAANEGSTTPQVVPPLVDLRMPAPPPA